MASVEDAVPSSARAAAVPDADADAPSSSSGASSASGTDRGPNAPTVDVVPFENEEDDLAQIRDLFVDGMKVNDAPDDYIKKSLGSDLNDAGSMREAYLSGRGTFLMLVEDEEDGDEEGHAYATTLEGDASDSDRRSSSGSSSIRRRNVRGMVGLHDVSPTTGSGADSNGAPEPANLCELRRMSIHSSRRRSGYGAKLVDACIAHAKREGFDGIKLYTGGWMEAAIRFYVRMGFEDRCRLDYVNRDGSTVEIAHLELRF